MEPARHALGALLTEQGRYEEDAVMQARFDAAWADSRVKLIGSCFCRTIPEKREG
jgi:hypothetical protein